METPQAAYIAMEMDRIHAVEMQNDRLIERMAQLEKRVDDHVNELHLLPGSLYTEFSDGRVLSWMMPGDPEMVLDADAAQPLDEAHWNAVVFTGATTIVLCEYANPALDDERMVVGRPGQHVTLRMLVDELDSALFEERDLIMTGNYEGEFTGFAQCSAGYKLTID
jgi:hypothetical protein